MFSNSTKYAIRTVLYLARNQEKKYTVQELGSALEIPTPFLSKILQQLSRSGIISSSKGRGGGFFLGTDTKRKRMIDVIISIEGYNIFDRCVLGLPECSAKNPCWMHHDFAEFRNRMEERLFKLSIKNLPEADFNL